MVVSMGVDVTGGVRHDANDAPREEENVSELHDGSQESLRWLWIRMVGSRVDKISDDVCWIGDGFSEPQESVHFGGRRQMLPGCVVIDVNRPVRV